MKIRFFAAILVAVFVLRFDAWGRMYIDDMDASDVNHVKQYSGFTAFVYPLSTVYMQDRTIFRFANTANPSASATYRVNGATEVTAAIYSPSGTFVSQDAMNPGQYILGVGANETEAPTAPALNQALFVRGTNAVYTREGGLKQLYYDGNRYLFGQVLAQPSGEWIGYGANIYYSYDNITFTRTQPSLVNFLLDKASGLRYEEYRAAVPAAALYVKVELNDVTVVPRTMAGVQEKAPASFISLASVAISGENLILGEPEPLISEPEDPYSAWYDYITQRSDSDENAEEPEEYEPEPLELEKSVPVKKIEPAAEIKPIESAQNPEQSSKPASKSSGAPAKFEGTIRLSPDSKAAEKEQAAEAQSALARQPVKTSAPDPARQPEPQTVKIVEIPRESGEESRFNKGVTGYIILVSGAILLTCVMPKKKL